MTMPENMGQDPDRAGALRGATLLVIVGAALGIGYNAMGLASRPHRGLAWIKQPEKIESLEALQGAPAPGAAETSMPAPGPGDAVAATMEMASTTSASASSTGTTTAKHDSTSAKHDSTSASKNSKSKSKSASAKSADKSAQASKGASAPAAGAASTSASTSATSTSAPAGASAPAAGSTGTAAVDLPTIPDVTGPLKVELATFKKLYDAKAALVIDAREAEEYTDGHIAGATSLPYNDAMAEPDKVKKLDPAGKPIVVYCSGGDCELSMDLAKLLVENGKRKVLVYEGGFPEWSGAGNPVTKGTNP